ncbi:peptidoglycan DD-metalloendopeptidase family protein [Rhodobacterales bacterium LSUCC0246]|nr:peptidoglycan DD-metalloendopeptidase family protein [Rhodobacterales bacterium LSUCC0374]
MKRKFSVARHLPVTNILAFGLSAALLSGCVGAVSDLDFDFRGNAISDADVRATAPLPEPDAQGLITYPNYQLAVARSGDTVRSVASRIGIDADSLARFNGRTADDPLRPNEILALPRDARVGSGGAGRDITQIASSAIDAAETLSPQSPAVQSGQEPVRHHVTRGETAYSIARLYNVSVRALSDWNGLGPDLEVREGQYLIIPLALETATGDLADGAVPGASTPPPPPSASQALPAPITSETLPAQQSAPAPASSTVPAPRPATQSSAPAPAPAAQPPVAAPAVADAGGALLRPVSGDIIRSFSASNEGVDINSAVGTPVRAAEAGEVAAITQDTDQVPILVLRHADGLLTVYANIRDITVSRGDRVSRGQTIAEVGPGAPSFLHFEVRRGFEAIDPTPFFE